MDNETLSSVGVLQAARDNVQAALAELVKTREGGSPLGIPAGNAAHVCIADAEIALGEAFRRISRALIYARPNFGEED